MAQTRKILDLSGRWNYKLDPTDCGVTKQWHLGFTEDGYLKLPGTLAENHIGQKFKPKEGLNKENVRCLRTEYQYVGVAWYQKEYKLEKEITLDEIEIFLERAMFQSTVWINGKCFGSNDSLSTPHIFRMADKPKSYKTLHITIRIDNRDIQKIGTYSSAFTDETQTLWNGIVGKMYVSEKRSVVIKRYNIGVDPDKYTGIFDIELSSDLMINKYYITIKSENSILQLQEGNVDLMGANYQIITSMDLNSEIMLWDEFHPHCYEIDLKIYNKQDVLIFEDERRTGFCQMKVKGKHIQVNNIKTFLRGNIDCCLYPMTGYPPMEKDMWYKVMRITKEYGFNHIRFHSWCPPEVAFEVADELGLYLQVEGPAWLDNWMTIEVGSTKTQYQYLPDEAKRIITSYSYHSSFCIFSNGNELNGDFSLLESIISKMKNVNPFLIYTLTTNWDRTLNKEDDIFIAQSADGIGIRGQYFLEDMENTTSLNFNKGTAERMVPMISHEVGQYVVYPNINEIDKYTGNLKPVNLETIRDDLMKKKLDKYVPDFVYCSGKLALGLYKAEFEAALNTENLSGIQILSLQDFQGQSTATVGLLDIFFDSKGITSEKEFQHFCSSKVLLLQLEKKIYASNEKINAKLNIANYGGQELYNVNIKLCVENGKNKVLHEEILTIKKLDLGLNRIGIVLKNLKFTNIMGRQKIKIIAMDGTGICNTWQIWVYEPIEKRELPFEAWDDNIIERLNAGQKIIIIPKPEQIRQLLSSKYFPVFWSPVHFTSKDPCGMILNDKHVFFSKFYKCEKYADYEWKVFMENAYAINLDALNDLEPLAMLVPNFYNNHKASPLFEMRLGKGKLLVCCYDFINSPATYQTEYLKKAIADYVNSDDFMPQYICSTVELTNLFKKEYPTEGGYSDIALKKKAVADSEKSDANAAVRGNDGNPVTCWIAADSNKGHYWQVDLGEIHNILGIKVEFNVKGRYLYVIHVSQDGKEWEIASNKTGIINEIEESTDLFETRARFVRIVYNDTSNGIMPGHKSFSVFS